MSIEDESTLVPIGTCWNHQLYKEEIASHIKRTSLSPKDSEWVGAFQMCVTGVINLLGGDEKVAKKFGEMAKTWNEAELP